MTFTIETHVTSRIRGFDEIRLKPLARLSSLTESELTKKENH